jgi:hypothetical protein
MSQSKTIFKAGQAGIDGITLTMDDLSIGQNKFNHANIEEIGRDFISYMIGTRGIFSQTFNIINTELRELIPVKLI